MKKSRNWKDIRESIENSFSLVRRNVETLAEKGGFSFDALNLRLSKATGDTVNSAFNAKIENLKSEERIGTMLICKNVLNKIFRSFIIKYKYTKTSEFFYVRR